MRQPVIVRTFEGDSVRGYIASASDKQDEAESPCPPLTGHTIFAAAEGDEKAAVKMDRIKAIHLMRDREDGADQVVRFFDSAPAPSTLWVRVSFRDGELMEGAIQNTLPSISAPLLELQPLDHKADRQCVWIPRAAIAELQVITVRE